MEIQVQEKTATIFPEKVAGKKVVMIIAPTDFRDEEYLISKEILEKEGVEIITASQRVGQALGVQGGEVKVDIALKDLKVEEYDGVIFIGGSGAHIYIDDSLCHQIVKEAVEKNKVLAAICIAPTILAKAGVLKGKNATVWSSVLDKSAVKILKGEGVNYLEENVVQDGKIITANGPDATEEFGETLVEVLRE